MDKPGLPRRAFLRHSATALGALGTAPLGAAATADPVPDAARRDRAALAPRSFDGRYEAEHLNHLAFPMGGLGAGMICLEGTGSLSEVSVRNHPDVFNEPCIFAGLAIERSDTIARVVEGPVPAWKIYGRRGAANGDEGSSYGLPRFAAASCQTRFPFCTVTLTDDEVPFSAEITGWSPFTPPDTDPPSLPVAALEYRFQNMSGGPSDAVFSFNAKNFLPLGDKDRRSVRSTHGGFVLWSAGELDEPWKEASFSVTVDDPDARVNCAWFRGGWWDPLTMAWRDVADAAAYDRPPVTGGEPSPGATIFVPFRLAPGDAKTIVIRLAWYAAETDLRRGEDVEGEPSCSTYKPWYAGRFGDVDEVMAHWSAHYEELKRRTQTFTDCFYDSTLPPEVLEAVSANLSILKSPTVLRQTDGRMWAWEGCSDDVGCCFGSCTHVWNYAQAIAHLFPSLERTLRETEFGPSQDSRGHQAFRTALPIRPQAHDAVAAADGQLGCIMKVHRDWRISGDTGWLRGLWPKVRIGLDYCIETWDPEHLGWLVEPHHNTYDIEFWGPDGMCTSFYLGALDAAVQMGTALGEDVSSYASLLESGRRRAEDELFDDEYFVQKIEWKELRALHTLDLDSYSPEARALFDREGPKYQYGPGCLSDGVLGEWIARVCGLGGVLAADKVTSHVVSVHRYNFKRDLSDHANPQRPSYAYGSEGGLLLCTWPKGGAPSLPFVYSDEVWTGIEYQVASHLVMVGHVEEGLEIVRACRARYDGRVRSPFDEYECGHWYARALSSYALLQAFSGARYDAVDGVLHVDPAIAGDFRSFLSTATGFGTVGVRDGRPFLDVRSGTIDVRRIEYPT